MPLAYGQADRSQGACLYWRVERGRSQGAGVNGVRWARGSRPAAKRRRQWIRGTAMTLPSLKARQKPPKPGLASRSVNRGQMRGYDRHHRQFDDRSWPRSRIAWRRLGVVKPCPCRLRNFASGLSALASLRTGFHSCSALSPTKAPSGRAAIGPFRRAALRGLLS